MSTGVRLPNAVDRCGGTVGQVTSFSLPDPDCVAAASDAELVDLLTAVQAELASRAVARADVPALIEDGFARGFTSAGAPVDPWLVSGILVCPGGKVDRSASAHTCAFVRVGDAWVWETDDLVEDVVRYLPGPKQQMRSVSLVAVAPGTAVDLVSARTKMGVHELVGVRSFVVSDDATLDLVSARAVRQVSHRPGG